MNRTIKEATVKRFHYNSHEQLRTHLSDFMAAYNFGRILPDPKLQLLRALTVRKAQMVEAHKRLSSQISAGRKQGVNAELEDMDSNLRAFIESQISKLE